MSNPTGLRCLGSYVHVLLMYLLHVLVAGCHVGGYFCPPFQSVVDSSLFNASYSHTRLVELGPWKDRRTEGVPYLIHRLLVELVTLFLKNLTFPPVLFFSALYHCLLDVA